MRVIKKKKHGRNVYQKESVKGLVFYAIVIAITLVIIAINLGL